MNGDRMRKMTAINMVLVLCAASASVTAQTDFKEPLNALGPKQKEFRALAVKGDYQGMRNIAFSYGAPLKGEAGSKIASCAWYLLIPAVHKEQFSAGDIGNISVYCNKLSLTEQITAYEYAFRTLAASSK